MNVECLLTDLTMLAEVLLGLVNVWLYSSWIRFRIPIGWAHFAMLLHKLESLDQTQHLIHGTTYGQIIDTVLTQHALGVNYKCATQRDAFLIKQHAVISGYFLGDVREQWVFQLANAAILTIHIAPS